jgi:hypothetical protein
VTDTGGGLSCDCVCLDAECAPFVGGCGWPNGALCVGGLLAGRSLCWLLVAGPFVWLRQYQVRCEWTLGLLCCALSAGCFVLFCIIGDL